MDKHCRRDGDDYTAKKGVDGFGAYNYKQQKFKTRETT